MRLATGQHFVRVIFEGFPDFDWEGALLLSAVVLLAHHGHSHLLPLQPDIIPAADIYCTPPARHYRLLAPAISQSQPQLPQEGLSGPQVSGYQAPPQLHLPNEGSEPQPDRHRLATGDHATRPTCLHSLVNAATQKTVSAEEPAEGVQGNRGHEAGAKIAELHQQQAVETDGTRDEEQSVGPGRPVTAQLRDVESGRGTGQDG